MEGGDIGRGIEEQGERDGERERRERERDKWEGGRELEGEDKGILVWKNRVER